MNVTLRAKAAAALLAAAAAAATLGLATAAPASATTFPGPTGSGQVLPGTGEFGDGLGQRSRDDLHPWRRVYKILHYTASGKVLCLDADGSAGAPGAGSAVTWYGCDPNFANQPNQLWTYAPVAHRANGDASTPSALVNIGSLASPPTSMDVRTTPILAAAANQQGTNSALKLVAQPDATAANSSWHLTDVASA